MKKNKLSSKDKMKQTPLIVDAFNFKDTNVRIKEEWNVSRKNFKFKEWIKNFLLILIGAFLSSLGFYYFITPAQLYNNGLSAFAQLITKAIFLNYENSDPELFNQMRALYYYPVFILMNLPFIIWGILKIGLRFSFSTIFYMAISSGLLALYSLTPALKDFKMFSDIIESGDKLATPFIFAALGGLICGTGLGLLFKSGGSSGGLDFVSTYISMKRRYSIATIIKNTNIIVVVIVIFIDGAILHKQNIADTYFSTPSFFATIFYIYISSFIMNRVYPKYMMITVFIISSEIPKIREYIYSNNYLRGGNLLKVKGLYSGREYDMMMTTMSLLEYNFFKQKLVSIDPSLFMITVTTTSIHGGNVGAYPKTKPKKG